MGSNSHTYVVIATAIVSSVLDANGAGPFLAVATQFCMLIHPQPTALASSTRTMLSKVVEVLYYI